MWAGKNLKALLNTFADVAPAGIFYFNVW